MQEFFVNGLPKNICVFNKTTKSEAKTYTVNLKKAGNASFGIG